MLTVSLRDTFQSSWKNNAAYLFCCACEALLSIWPLVGRPSRNNRHKLRLYPLGVDTAKEVIYSRLRITEPGPGYYHFPLERDKEYFQQFWDYDSPTWAGKFLDLWCKEVMRSRIEPLKKFVRTVRNHRELLLNYFRARKAFSSGIVEGLNNKAKVTMRKAYGFRTFKMLELALYHVLGKLPEPKLTHSFY